MKNITPSGEPIHSAWQRTACALCITARGAVAIPEHTLRMTGKGFMGGIEISSGMDPTGGFFPLLAIVSENPILLGIVILPGIIGAVGGAAVGAVTGITTTVMAVPEAIFQLVRPGEPQTRGAIHRAVFG
jgi:hypothetical protein